MSTTSSAGRVPLAVLLLVGTFGARPCPAQFSVPHQECPPVRNTDCLTLYQVRPGDQLAFSYLKAGRPSTKPYRLMVGDELLIESFKDPAIGRGDLRHGLVIQPDGSITLRLVGQVQAAGLTIEQLREVVAKKYAKYHPADRIDVTPVRVNALLESLLTTSNEHDPLASRALPRVVGPDGHVQLPKLGSVFVSGLTMEELKEEVNLRYAEHVSGLEVDPVLVAAAPMQIFVLGAVEEPGQATLSGPTTVWGAIALAGGQRPGANMRQVIVMRHGEDGQVIYTIVHLVGMSGTDNFLPSEGLWLADGDVVVVPEVPVERLGHGSSRWLPHRLHGLLPPWGRPVQDPSNPMR